MNGLGFFLFFFLFFSFPSYVRLGRSVEWLIAPLNAEDLYTLVDFYTLVNGVADFFLNGIQT